MKIKSLHAHVVIIPRPGEMRKSRDQDGNVVKNNIPGKDRLEFKPGEIKEVDEQMGNKILQSKGFELVQESVQAKSTKKGGK